MKEFCCQLFTFLKGVYSESDGTPSSSRILSLILALVASFVLIVVTLHIIKIQDLSILTVWLSSLPLLISSLVLFFTAPYGVNKGSGSISDLLSLFKKKDN